MPMDRVVVRYHEVALKGRNRTMFVRQLTHNILRMVQDVAVHHPSRAPGRIILPLKSAADWPKLRTRLRHVFGIANFLLCERAPRSLEALSDAVSAAVATQGFGSFAVRTKRSDKTFPMPSPEICRVIGRAVQDTTGWRVDLRNPELEIHIEILPRDVLFALEKIDGPGGLPIGSSGTVLALLSGGIDSPVAAHRMMRRGCHLEFVHFHGAPFQSRASQEKASEILDVLSRWQPDTRLHLIPFGPVQREIVTHSARRTRVVLYRRMMMRIAQVIAERVGATALVTGDSLGQVASQTLPNVAVIEDACALPVLRPLIGMDKQEITTQSQQLGTYPISIQPDDDCCQLFVPRHPATGMTTAEADRAEQPLDIPALIALAVDHAETATLAFPAGKRVSGARCHATGLAG